MVPDTNGKSNPEEHQKRKPRAAPPNAPEGKQKRTATGKGGSSEHPYQKKAKPPTKACCHANKKHPREKTPRKK